MTFIATIKKNANGELEQGTQQQDKKYIVDGDEMHRQQRSRMAGRQSDGGSNQHDDGGINPQQAEPTFKKDRPHMTLLPIPEDADIPQQDFRSALRPPEP